MSLFVLFYVGYVGVCCVLVCVVRCVLCCVLSDVVWYVPCGGSLLLECVVSVVCCVDGECFMVCAARCLLPACCRLLVGP